MVGGWLLLGGWGLSCFLPAVSPFCCVQGVFLFGCFVVVWCWVGADRALHFAARACNQAPPERQHEALSNLRIRQALPILYRLEAWSPETLPAHSPLSFSFLFFFILKNVLLLFLFFLFCFLFLFSIILLFLFFPFFSVNQSINQTVSQH